MRLHNNLQPAHTYDPGASPTDPAEVRAASLTVAANARDADDCRSLLRVLGLLPDTSGSRLRRCTLCHVRKPRSEYGADPRREDGLATRCTPCRAKERARRKRREAGRG